MVAVCKNVKIEEPSFVYFKNFEYIIFVHLSICSFPPFSLSSSLTPSVRAALSRVPERERGRAMTTGLFASVLSLCATP